MKVDTNFNLTPMRMSRTLFVQKHELGILLMTLDCVFICQIKYGVHPHHCSLKIMRDEEQTMIALATNPAVFQISSICGPQWPGISRLDLGLVRRLLISDAWRSKRRWRCERTALWGEAMRVCESSPDAHSCLCECFVMSDRRCDAKALDRRCVCSPSSY